MARPGAVAAIVSLGWPMFIGQLAVMANGLVDMVMAGHLSADDLAAVAIGSSVYFVVYVGMMGSLQSISPVAAQHFGARRMREVGETWRQGQWMAAMLGAPGLILLAFPAPLLSLTQSSEAVQAGAIQYLQGVAWGLPAALWFRAFSTLNAAVSRTRLVMAINLLGPALKVPLNALFMHGSDGPVAVGLPALPALGGAGCGWATAVVYWISAGIGLVVLRRSRFYAPFSIRGLGRPHWPRLAKLFRLGLPIGGMYLIDVSAFNLMTLLVARLGTATVGGHAIASNMAALLYMLPMAMASATSVLAAQAIGRGDSREAVSVANTGVALISTLAAVCALGLFMLRETVAQAYTDRDEVALIAAGLLAWVALYHLLDALQCGLAFVLRAWKVAVLPMVIFALALWGVGLGGGTWLALGLELGAPGFWIAAILALMCSAVALALLYRRTVRSH